MKSRQTFLLVFPLLFSAACQDQKGKTRYQTIEVEGNNAKPPDSNDAKLCKAELQDLCRDVQGRIEAKQQDILKLANAGDIAALQAAQLDLNELMEIYDSYLNGKADVLAIQEHYQSLRQILAVNSDDPSLSITYQKEEADAVREVFAAYGELTIDPAIVTENANDKSKTVSYSTQEAGTPWAAYWYPRRGKEMFEGEASPLSKLDTWLTSQGRSSAAVAWEQEHYESNAAEWEGLCDAWAMAAVMTREPRKGVVVDGIPFSAADLKAIAIKYYQGYEPRIYGRRYQGLAATDGLIQDLRPEAFHRLMEEYLGRQKKPVVIDEEPGPEVWSKPLFRYAFNISKDPDRAQALLVKAFPWMIRQRSEVDGSLTSLATDLAAPAYEYRLYYDAKPLADGRLRIIAGEWLGTSLNAHPDMVFLPAEQENKAQPNPEIHKNGADIRLLLEKAGMLKP